MAVEMWIILPITAFLLYYSEKPAKLQAKTLFFSKSGCEIRCE